jgi:hypothetical protein
MHSEWIIARRIPDRRAPKEWLGHHLSTGCRTPVDVEALQLLADQIFRHSHRYQRVWQFAMRVTVGRTVAEWELLFTGPTDDHIPSAGTLDSARSEDGANRRTTLYGNL